MSEQVLYKAFAPSGRVGQTCENSVVYYLLRWYITTFIGGKVPDIYQQLPIHLKTGAWVRPSVFSIQLFSFFLNPYMDKGFENPEERDWLFCNVFFIIILYYIYNI